jgi:hypothetical protein
MVNLSSFEGVGITLELEHQLRYKCTKAERHTLEEYIMYTLEGNLCWK